MFLFILLFLHASSMLVYSQENGTSEIISEQQERKMCELVFWFSSKLTPFLSQDKNFIISPVSLYTILNLVVQGSDGETKTQIENVLGFKEFTSYEEIKRNVKTAETTLKNSGSCTVPPCGASKLFMETGAFVDKNTPLLPEFTATLKNTSRFESVEFINADATANTINTWASTSTNNLIPTITQREEILPNMKMIFVNIIYFKGSWMNKFDPANTQQEVFHGLQGDKTVPMMHLEGRFMVAYNSGLKFMMVILPYSGLNISMGLILPEKGTDTAQIMKNMHTGELNQICENETPDAVIKTEVSLKVPKFTFNVEVPLKEHMKSLGVRDLFEKGKANLKKMSSLELYVDEIFHIANINVNEEGTEAAAISKVSVVENRMMDDGPTQMFFNRPFLFKIFSNEEKIPLFMGQVLNVEINSNSAPVNPA